MRDITEIESLAQNVAREVESEVLDVVFDAINATAKELGWAKDSDDYAELQKRTFQNVAERI